MDAVSSSKSEASALPNILVVDDELGYREGIRRVLSNRGYRVQTAEGGRAALALSARDDYDFPIVLVDLKMPDLDGFQVIDGLRARHPETLCIVVSAFATIESAVQTTKMGAFDFVAKPFTVDELVAAVARAKEKWYLQCEATRLRSEREFHLLELAAEKSRLRTILQSMGDGLLVVNVNGDVVLDNPVARRLLDKVQSPSLVGPLFLHLPDDGLLEEVGRMLDGRATETSVTTEIRLRHDENAVRVNGDTRAPADRYLRATLAPIRDEPNTVLGVVVLLSDITDTKAFERMKTLFVSMVAHEIKAPIGAVEGYLHLIESGTLDQDPERLHKVAGRCLERTGALLSLVQDLLELTRRETVRIARRIEPVDVAKVAENLLDFARQEAEARHISLSLVVAPGLLPILADRNDIERILTNLISNAVKYNRDNGSVTVRLSRDGAVFRIEVVDTGIGMSPEEVERLGEEFFRAKNLHTRTITGTGLGVALMKKIVQSYNGAMEVDSVVDQGSNFRVLLPVPSQAPSSMAPAG